MSSNNNVNNHDNMNDPSSSAVQAARAALAAAASAAASATAAACHDVGITMAPSNIIASRSYPTNHGHDHNHHSPKPASQASIAPGNSYPLPAYCRFVPGGIEYLPASQYRGNHAEGDAVLLAHSYSTTPRNA